MLPDGVEEDRHSIYKAASTQETHARSRYGNPPAVEKAGALRFRKFIPQIPCSYETL
jgi:hypothetical protein